MNTDNDSPMGGLAMQAGGVPTFMKLIKKLTTDIKKAEKAGDLETSLAKRKELNSAIKSGVNDPLMPRAQPLTQAEIRMYAERMAPQVAGELTRGADAKTVAGKSQKQFKREQTLPVDRKVLPGAVDPSAPLPYMTLEDQKGSVLLGLPGDPTLARVSVSGIGDVPFEQAVTQHGGPRYGDENKLWASNLGAATGLLNAADRASRQFGDAPVIASYMKMPSGFGFAQHYLETLLQYQRPDLLNKAARKALEKDIKAGFIDDGKRITFPNFPGFDDLGAVAQAAENDSILRKHIAAKLGTSEKYGLRPAADVQFAISHPELTNLETGASGFTLGELTPGLLTESAHPTYSHDIPGKVLGQTQYPTPYDLFFRDQLGLIRNNPEAPEFGTLKMLGARQKIDEQLVNEINEYQERMRRLLGRKKGGAVNKAEGGSLTDLPDEVNPSNWREHLQNNVRADAQALLGVKDGGAIDLNDLIEQALKKKDGGAIDLNDLIEWTLAKKEHRKMKEGGAVKMADGGQTFPLQRPEEVTDLKPRPRTKRDELLEMLSKGVGSVHEFMAKPFGYENPPGEMVSSLIGLPGAAKTLERMAYGDPLTSGAGMTTNLLPETTEAAMLALGAAPTVLKATKNLPVGLSIKPTDMLDMELASKMKAEKIKAPANPVGFYNPAEKAALNLQRKKGPGSAFISDLKKQPGVTDERIAELGLTDLASNPNVTREDVIAAVEQNRIPLRESVRRPYQEADEFSETADALKESIRFREGGIQQVQAELDRVRATAPDSPLVQQYERKIETMRESIARDQQKLEGAKPSLYGPDSHPDYNMPGGENYREIRVALPENKAELPSTEGFTVETLREIPRTGQRDVRIRDAQGNVVTTLYTEFGDDDRILRTVATQLNKEEKGKNNFYQKTHHGDEPNVLFHLRVADHVDEEGKKGLLIDELQSDWHQTGREKGYKGETPQISWEDPEYVAARRRATELLNEFNRNSGNPAKQKEIRPLLDQATAEERRFTDLSNAYYRAVPDAPFKDNWYQLGLKRAIKEAADTGMDRVYLTTGALQNKRYDLGKHIDRISLFPNEFPNKTTRPYYFVAYDKTGRRVMDDTVTPEKLQEYIGKDASKKLLDIDPDKEGVRYLTGADLSIGGEGMRQYYDKNYKNYLEKYAKQHGGKLGMTKIADGEPVYYIDITDAMRESAKKGQSYAFGGGVFNTDPDITDSGRIIPEHNI